MRKNVLACVLSLGWLLGESAQALEFERVTDLSPWVPFTTADAQITVNGDRATLSADASPTNENHSSAALTSPTNADGIMVTFNVSSATTSANGSAHAVIIHNVGKLGENFVEAWLNVALDEEKQVHWIFAQIRERTPEHKIVRYIYQASFGDFDDIPEWQPGQDVTIAIARFGDEIWFFVNGYPILMKYFWFAPIPLERIDAPVKISVSADNGENFQAEMTATVSNVFFLFEDASKSTESPAQTLLRLANSKR